MTLRFPSQPRLRSILTLAIVSGIALATLWALGWRLEEANTVVISDLASYFLPKYEYGATQFAAGAAPLWNPLEFGGIPFAATIQTTVFYAPMRLAYSGFAITSESAVPPAYQAYYLLHLLLAPAFTFYMLRRLGCGSAAAALGSLWILHPASLVHSYTHPIFLPGMVWLPLSIALVHATVHAPSLRRAVALAATASLLATSGYPPIALAATYVLALGLPFWLWERRALESEGGALRIGFALALAILLATGLAAVQLLPSLELTQLTERSTTGPQVLAQIEEQQSASPAMLDWARLHALPPFTFTDGLERVWSGVGPIWIGLCLAALAFGGRLPARWFFLALAVAGNLLPYRILAKLPFYEYVRYGIEWTYIGVFAFFALAALGFQAILDRAPRLRPFAAVASVVLLVATIAWSWGNGLGNWSPRERPRPRRVLPASVVEACDAGLGRQRIFWPRGQAQGALISSRVPSVGGYEQSLIPGRTVELARRLRLGNGMVPGGWEESFARNRGALSRLALSCVVTPQPRELLANAGYEVLSDLAPGMFVYRNPDASPPARLATRVLLADSPEAALASLIERREADTDLVAFEAAPPPIAGPCPDPNSGKTEIVRYEAETVAIATQSSCDSYLVLADQHYPGWQVRVDGSAAELLRADYNLRAVRVPAGTHEVVFRYAPDSVRNGKLLSIVAGILAVVGVAVPGRSDPLRRMGGVTRGRSRLSR